MGKKNSLPEKAEAGKAAEDIELAQAGDGAIDSDIDNLMESLVPAGSPETARAADDIDLAGILKATGGIKEAVKGTVPKVDQIASQAKLAAQQASAMAMKAYVRQLKGIVQEMQGTIREEGARLADEICVRIAAQVRQAILLETEKKAMNLVDEFVLNWQIEAETMSASLLDGDPSDADEPVAQAKPVEAVVIPPVTEAAAKDSPRSGADTAKEVITPAAQAEATAKNQPEASHDNGANGEGSGGEKKVVFDFASFIAQSKAQSKN